MDATDLPGGDSGEPGTQGAFASESVVVLLAGVPFAAQRLGVHHIAEELSRRTKVLYVEPGSPGADPRLSSALRMASPSLSVFRPLTPPARTRLLVRDAVRATLDLQVRRALRHLGGTVTAVAIGPPWRPGLRSLGSEVRRAHLASDDFVAGAELMGMSREWIRRNERRLARQLDLVIAVSEPIAEAWRARGVRAEVVANGCDVGLFARTDTAVPAPDVDLAAPIAVVAGTLSDRIDVTILRSVAERMSLLLVGQRSHSSPNRELDALLRMSSVQWAGPQPFDAMPSYLARCSVGLTPYADTAFNRASFPLKTLDYLAAGLPVVATDLPSVRALGTDLVTVATGPGEFARCALDASSASSAPDARERRRAFAQQYSWEAQGAKVARALGVPAS